MTGTPHRIYGTLRDLIEDTPGITLLRIRAGNHGMRASTVAFIRDEDIPADDLALLAAPEPQDGKRTLYRGYRPQGIPAMAMVAAFIGAMIGLAITAPLGASGAGRVAAMAGGALAGAVAIAVYYWSREAKERRRRDQYEHLLARHSGKLLYLDQADVERAINDMLWVASGASSEAVWRDEEVRAKRRELLKAAVDWQLEARPLKADYLLGQRAMDMIGPGVDVPSEAQEVQERLHVMERHADEARAAVEAKRDDLSRAIRDAEGAEKASRDEARAEEARSLAREFLKRAATS